MPEIVRYVVWHPQRINSVTGSSPEAAWFNAAAEESVRLMATIFEDALKRAGWRCSEVRTDG